MNHCQHCGGLLELESDAHSCGGFGNIYKCKGCGARFQQKTGGAIVTPGGETLKPLPRDPFEDKLSTPDDPKFLSLLRRLANGRP